MFLGYQGDKIKFYTEQPLNETIYNLTKIEETEDEYILFDEEYVLKSDPKVLHQAKENKYQEALDGANYFLDKEALYELTPDFHVEATKENMNTLTSASIAIEKGLIEHQVWTSKEDNVLALTQEQCMIISFGIGAIQGDVWSRQFIIYKNAIEEAETLEEVEAIKIAYAIPAEEQDSEAVSEGEQSPSDIIESEEE